MIYIVTKSVSLIQGLEGEHKHLEDKQRPASIWFIFILT